MSDSIAPGSTVLVTGGTGFLGRAVLRALEEGGYRARAFQRSATSRASSAASATGDVRDPEAVGRAVSGADAVVHAAGLAHVFTGADRAPFSDVNETGTDVVARAAVAAGVRRLILVSSVSVYGGTANGGAEDAPLCPKDAYARSKAAAEGRSIAAVSGTATGLTILRMATLYGDGDRGNVQRLLRAIAAGRFIWIGSGANHKSLLHVDDAARACVLPLTMPVNGVEVFNVSAAPATMRAIVDGLAAALGRASPRVRIPASVAAGIARGSVVLGPRGRALDRTVTKWLADDAYPADRFRDHYGFRPQVDLDAGLRGQAAWWREHEGRS